MGGFWPFSQSHLDLSRLYRPPWEPELKPEPPDLSYPPNGYPWAVQVWEVNDAHGNPGQSYFLLPGATLLSSLVNIPKLKNNVASLPLNANAS